MASPAHSGIGMAAAQQAEEAITHVIKDRLHSMTDTSGFEQLSLNKYLFF
jgi:hypothetical protein